MKTLIFIATFFIIGACGAQKKTTSKATTTTFKVEGVCGMCEKRIEKAMDIVGVSFADWVKETSMLTVTFNPKKVSEEELHQILAKAGHRTSKLKQDEKAYGSLPGCCKYDDGIDKH